MNKLLILAVVADEKDIAKVKPGIKCKSLSMEIKKGDNTSAFLDELRDLGIASLKELNNN